MTNSSQAPEPCWPWRKKRNASSKLAGHATAVRRRNKSFGLGVAPPSASQNDNLSPVYVFFFFRGGSPPKTHSFVTITFWEGEHPNIIISQFLIIFGSYSFYTKAPQGFNIKLDMPEIMVHSWLCSKQTDADFTGPGGEKIMKLQPTQVPLKLKENKPLIRTLNKK